MKPNQSKGNALPSLRVDRLRTEPCLNTCEDREKSEATVLEPLTLLPAWLSTTQIIQALLFL